MGGSFVHSLNVEQIGEGSCPVCIFMVCEIVESQNDNA